MPTVPAMATASASGTSPHVLGRLLNGAETTAWLTVADTPDQAGLPFVLHGYAAARARDGDAVLVLGTSTPSAVLARAWAAVLPHARFCDLTAIDGLTLADSRDAAAAAARRVELPATGAAVPLAHVVPLLRGAHGRLLVVIESLAFMDLVLPAPVMTEWLTDVHDVVDASSAVRVAAVWHRGLLSAAEAGDALPGLAAPARAQQPACPRTSDYVALLSSTYVEYHPYMQRTRPAHDGRGRHGAAATAADAAAAAAEIFLGTALKTNARRRYRVHVVHRATTTRRPLLTREWMTLIPPPLDQPDPSRWQVEAAPAVAFEPGEDDPEAAAAAAPSLPKGAARPAASPSHAAAPAGPRTTIEVTEAATARSGGSGGMTITKVTPARSAAASETAAPEDPMAQITTFNLGLTEQQRADRAKVALPYTLQAQKAAPSDGRIEYEYDEGDDYDEDDLDDDLDI
ncbi:hypothetical protein CXG81DRAFT_17610 [Caulochytrium protostelioides]|uniref:Elongator complex protein 5 n=1 Tax=Caulochytrium protostelioides TaxID=1555241 RepID=A0A4P9XBE2_9FUNG|nr:hypothetical protein CXG81DRAFT_17610 [Caulochytrium protostelioides]|eukprot:RKP02723.1 hypothetical protein CXG81DRAFT_17610 [Caulochytrium protostelioides]